MKQCICGKCGKQYEIFPSQKGGFYCSKKCFLSLFIKRKTKSCLVCSKKFTTKPPKDERFCSLPCYWKSMKLPEDVLELHAKQNTKKYRKEHPEWCAEVKQRRRAREVGAGGHFTAQEWRETKERQEQKCAICKEAKKLTVDHVIPLSKGGSNYKENIQGLCGSCNSRKWAKI